MPIIVEWDNPEKTVIRQKYVGKWTWDEFFDACTKQSAGLMKTVPHTVHILADYSESGPLPLGGAVSQARTVTQYYPDNWGLLIIVSGNMFIKTLVNIFAKTYSRGAGAHTAAAATFEDAYKLVANYAKTHPETPPSDSKPV